MGKQDTVWLRRYINANRAILYGMMLGDGYIVGRGRNTYFGITHALNQAQYLRHKAEMLRPIVSPRGIVQREPRIIGQASLYFNTITNVEWQKIWSIFHQDSKAKRDDGRLSYPKRITSQVLDALDDHSLAIWIMDDGSLTIQKGRRLKLCTHCYSLEDNNLVAEWINDCYHADAKVSFESKRDKTYPFIHIGAIGYNRIVPRIEPYIIPSMHYKIDMKYKHTAYQTKNWGEERYQFKFPDGTRKPSRRSKGED